MTPHSRKKMFISKLMMNEMICKWIQMITFYYDILHSFVWPLYFPEWMRVDRRRKSRSETATGNSAALFDCAVSTKWFKTFPQPIRCIKLATKWSLIISISERWTLFSLWRGRQGCEVVRLWRISDILECKQMPVIPVNMETKHSGPDTPHSCGVSCVAVSPNSNYILSGGQDGEILIHDSRTYTNYQISC